MAQDDAASQGPALASLCIAMITLSILAISVRVWCKIILHHSAFHRWGLDDTFAVIGLPFAIVVPLDALLWVRHGGLGQHASQLSPETMSLGLRYYYPAPMLYAAAVACVKFSVLCFYARVFSVQEKSFRKKLWITAGFVVIWLFYTSVIALSQCSPTQKLWLPWIPGTCIANDPWFIVSGTNDVILDVVMFCLPIPLLWRMHLSTGKKLRLVFLFFCGYSVLVVSFGRLITTIVGLPYGQDDFTWNNVPVFSWLICEAPLLMVSMCMPSVLCLVQRARRHGPRALFSRRNFHRDSLRGKGEEQNPYARATFHSFRNNLERKRDRFMQLSRHNSSRGMTAFEIDSKSRTICFATKPHGLPAPVVTRPGRVHVSREVSVVLEPRMDTNRMMQMMAQEKGFDISQPCNF